MKKSERKEMMEYLMKDEDGSIKYYRKLIVRWEELMTNLLQYRDLLVLTKQETPRDGKSVAMVEKRLSEGKKALFIHDDIMRNFNK